MTSPISAAATQGAWGRLSRNAGKIIAHKSESLLQNTDSFKTNALAFSSATIVLSRMAVAHFSAMKARGTPEGPYRYREAIRTDMREIGGFSLIFLVFKAFLETLKMAMRWKFGIRKSGGIRSYPMFRELRQAVKNRHDPAYDLTLPTHPKHRFDLGLERMRKVTYQPTKCAEGFLAGVDKIRQGIFKQAALTPTAKEKLMTALYEWGPVGIGSVMGVAMGGYALERLTRDHSDAVLDFFSRRSGGKGADGHASGSGTQANALYPVGLSGSNASAPSSLNPNVNRPNPNMSNPNTLDSFVNRVYQKKYDRSQFAGKPE